MEYPGWMNEEVRQEIEDLRRAHGLEEEEATAFWHLAHARMLMVRLRIEDERARVASVEEELAARGPRERIGEEMADVVTHMTTTESRVAQHFSALYRELGLRVLRRSYPEGWTDTRI